MNKYKMFFTLLFSMMLVLVALTSATTETYAQGNATYNVTRWRADGHHIRIELANRGTGLGVFLKKSGRDGKGYRFTNRGRYWIEARTPDGRRRYTWGPYTYDSRVQNYQERASHKDQTDLKEFIELLRYVIALRMRRSSDLQV